jgi:hypothetical protein
VGEIGAALLLIFVMYFVYMVVAQFVIGQLALIFGAIYCGVQIKRTVTDFLGRSYRNFFIALIVTLLLFVALIAAVGRDTACDGYYIGKVFGSGYGPQQNGTTVSADNYSQVCHFPGFRYACSQFDECRSGVPFLRPLPIFIFGLLCAGIGVVFGISPFAATSKVSRRTAIDKTEASVTSKVCLRCYTVNQVSALVCYSCSEVLPSLQEISAKRLVDSKQQAIEKEKLKEQQDALKQGISKLGELVESRARLCGDAYLAQVSEAYLTGRLRYQSPAGFQSTNREEIYITGQGEQRYEDVTFPLSPEKGRELAYEIIARLYSTERISRRKTGLWDREVKLIYGFADLFPKSDKTHNGVSHSVFYDFMLEQEKDLFLKVQASVAKWEVERHVKYDKKRLDSLTDYLKQRVPHPSYLTTEFESELEEMLKGLFEAKELRRLKRNKRKVP